MSIQGPAIDESALRGGEIMDEARLAVEARDSASGFAFEGEGLSDIYGERLDFSGCTFIKCRIGSMDVKWLSFSDCRFVGCDFSNARLGKAGLKRVELIDCKLTGAEMPMTAMAHVKLSDCAAEFLNLGDGKLTDVAFERTNLSNAIFSGAVLKRVAFQACAMQRTEFYGTPLKGFDLRGNDLTALGVRGPELSGAVVSADQAMELAKILGVVIR